MRRFFYISSALIFITLGLASVFWSPALWILLFVVPFFIIGLHNALQRKKAILRNFPILGAFRYFFEMIRPEIQQYFVESDTDGAPVPRELRSVVYQRAKQQIDTLAFGTQLNVYAEGYEWVSHSLAPKTIDLKDLRVTVGGPQCLKPYSASIFNISAMSYGALSKNAVLALNGGAKLGAFYHNTGEGGLSPYHLAEGADVVWQIGTGYFGCRNDEGGFCPQSFREKALYANVKMIEIKLSQGAKPAHGGILPAAKITPEIAAIRKVKPGRDVISPPAHSEFSTPKELLRFVAKLRDLSDGKPIGIKLCVGRPSEFMALCKAMLEFNTFPDFITVDGGEGGTGAAPLEFSNNVGMPLEEGLTLIHDVLTGFGLRQHIRIICSGKVLTGFHIFSRLALGADICNSARGMMLALGCIQARRCNTNHCPTGVATSNPELMYGLVPSDKRVRVANYHKHTVHAFSELLGAAGLTSTRQIQRVSVFRRVTGEQVKTYEDLFPSVQSGAFLKEDIPELYRHAFSLASADSFETAAHTTLEDRRSITAS